MTRAVLLALVAMMLGASPAFAAKACLENDTEWSVQIVPTVERPDGSQDQIRSDDIPPGTTTCAEFDGRFVRIQAWVAVIWNNLPANYKHDCPPRDGDGLVYRVVGDAAKTAHCEFVGWRRD